MAELYKTQRDNLSVQADQLTEGIAASNFVKLSGTEESFYELPDNVIPSSNSVMALNLYYLAGYFENAEWSTRSITMLGDIKAEMIRHSVNYSNWARLLMHEACKFHIMVITGPDAEQKADEVNSMYLPGLRVAASSSESSEIPLFRERYRKGETWYYVCSRGYCKMPVMDLSLALEQIK